MNAHQRRVARRLYERAFGNHVDYYVSIPLSKQFRRVEPDGDYEPKWGYCQQCGAMLEDDAEPHSPDVVRRPYATASGDLYCDVCGRAMDEAEEALFDEENEFDLWDYNTWEDIATGETGGRYIGEGSDVLPDDDDTFNGVEA